MPVPPQEYTPSLFHSPSTAPLPFQGFNNRSDQEFSELCSCCWTPSRRNHFPNNLSHLERVSHRPDNLLLQSTGLTTRLFKTTGLTTCFFCPAPKTNGQGRRKQQNSSKAGWLNKIPVHKLQRFTMAEGSTMAENG
jgi:hypothetical protein